jgi:hypothetical protein
MVYSRLEMRRVNIDGNFGEKLEASLYGVLYGYEERRLYRWKFW